MEGGAYKNVFYFVINFDSVKSPSLLKSKRVDYNKKRGIYDCWGRGARKFEENSTKRQTSCNVISQITGKFAGNSIFFESLDFISKKKSKKIEKKKIF